MHGLLDAEPQLVYLPKNFDSHVQPVQFSMDQLRNDDVIFAVEREPKHDADQDLQPDQQQVSPNLFSAERESDDDPKEPHDASFTTTATPAGKRNEIPMTAAEQPHLCKMMRPRWTNPSASARPLTMTCATFHLES